MAREGYLADPGRCRHAKATSAYRHIMGVCGSPSWRFTHLLDTYGPATDPRAASTRCGTISVTPCGRRRSLGRPAAGRWRVKAQRLGGPVAEGYGVDFSVATLAAAIGQVRYPGIDLRRLHRQAARARRQADSQDRQAYSGAIDRARETTAAQPGGGSSNAASIRSRGQKLTKR